MSCHVPRTIRVKYLIFSLRVDELGPACRSSVFVILTGDSEGRLYERLDTLNFSVVGDKLVVLIRVHWVTWVFT